MSTQYYRLVCHARYLTSNTKDIQSCSNSWGDEWEQRTRRYQVARHLHVTTYRVKVIFAQACRIYNDFITVRFQRTPSVLPWLNHQRVVNITYEMFLDHRKDIIIPHRGQPDLKTSGEKYRRTFFFVFFFRFVLLSRVWSHRERQYCFRHFARRLSQYSKRRKPFWKSLYKYKTQISPAFTLKIIIKVSRTHTGALVWP